MCKCVFLIIINMLTSIKYSARQNCPVIRIFTGVYLMLRNHNNNNNTPAPELIRWHAAENNLNRYHPEHTKFYDIRVQLVSSPKRTVYRAQLEKNQKFLPHTCSWILCRCIDVVGREVSNLLGRSNMYDYFQTQKYNHINFLGYNFLS